MTAPAGAFLLLVGASGCGKSTLLRLIAGCEPPTVGTVRTGGRLPEPGRGAGLVFQPPRLLPWKTVGGTAGGSAS
jgi:taurine transport system ATP-binding protein